MNDKLFFKAILNHINEVHLIVNSGWYRGIFIQVVPTVMMVGMAFFTFIGGKNK